jgi:hypothetical protein
VKPTGVAGVELPPDSIDFEVIFVGNSPPESTLKTGGRLPVTFSLLFRVGSAT